MEHNFHHMTMGKNRLCNVHSRVRAPSTRTQTWDREVTPGIHSPQEGGRGGSNDDFSRGETVVNRWFVSFFLLVVTTNGVKTTFLWWA